MRPVAGRPEGYRQRLRDGIGSRYTVARRIPLAGGRVGMRRRAIDG